MLAAANSHDEDDDMGIATTTKRRSMLKKTMQAIGKVKPKFKSGKSKNTKMELFNSCSSFDFDLEHVEEDSDGSSTVSQAEDDEKPPEKIPGEPDIPEDLEQEEDENVKSEELGNIKSSKESDDERRLEQPASAPSTPLVQPKEKLQRSTGNDIISMQVNSGALQLDSGSSNASKGTVTLADVASSSPKKPSSTRKSGVSRSPIREKSTIPRPKKLMRSPVPEKRRVVAAPKKAPASPRPNPVESTQKGSELESPKASSRSLSASMLAIELIENLPPQHEIPEDRVEENEESFKRCSLAFENDEALGGYFSKLHDLKQKDPVKPQSWNPPRDRNAHAQGNRTSVRHVLNTGEGSVEFGKGSKHPNPGEDSQNFEGDNDNSQNKEEKKATAHGSSFKTPKRIKKLFSLKRSSSKDSDENSPKENMKSNKTLPDKVDSSQHETAQMMEELSIMLSPTNRHSPKSKKSDKSRHVPTIDDGEDADDDDDSPSEDYPEIPKEKKTSLSDIRRMMDASKTDTSGASTLTRQTGRRDLRKTSLDSKPTKEQMNSSPTTVIDGPPLEENLEDQTAPRRRRSGTNRRSSFNATENVIPEEEEVKPELPDVHPLTDDHVLQSPRRHRHRTSKRPSSESSSSSDTKSSPQGPHQQASDGNPDRQAKEKESSPSSQRRRRGSRRSDGANARFSIKDAIAEDEVVDSVDESDPPPPPGTPSTPSANRSKRSHRRSTAKRTSEGSTAQANTPDSTLNRQEGALNRSDVPLDQSDDYVERPPENTEIDEGAAASSSAPFTTKRTRPGHKNTRAASVHRPSKGGADGTSLRGKCERSASMRDLKKTRDSLVSPRKQHHSGHLTRGYSERQLSQKSASAQESVVGREEAVEAEEKEEYESHEEEPTGVGNEQKGGDVEIKRKANNPSLSESFEKNAQLKTHLFDDGQYSISTDGGSEMFVKGKISYSSIKSSDNLSAPQLIIGPIGEETENNTLGVKNI
jgi:hypothetical protein